METRRRRGPFIRDFELPQDRRLRFVFFFFQAEDGIRDDLVTGVQTCALPISYLTLQKRNWSLSPAVILNTQKSYWPISLICASMVTTKALSTIPTSRRSTSHCRTACMQNGPSEHWKAASMSYVRSP